MRNININVIYTIICKYPSISKILILKKVNKWYIGGVEKFQTYYSDRQRRSSNWSLFLVRHTINIIDFVQDDTFLNIPHTQ